MRNGWIAAVMLLAGCSGLPKAPTINCSAAPPGFGRWNDPSRPNEHEPRDVNTIRVTRDGRILWNGADLGGAQDMSPFAVLDMYLQQVAILTPRPWTTVVFDKNASCAQVVRVRALMERELICSTGRDCLQGAVPGHSS